MNTYLQPCLLFLFFICSPLVAMDVMDTSDIEPKQIALLTTSNNVNPDITFVEKKYLEESTLLKKLFSSIKNASTISLLNTPYPINRKILKELLLPCLRYIYVINNPKTTDLYKKNTRTALNNLLYNTPNYYLHILINNANYFEITYLLNRALKLWTHRNTGRLAMELFHTNSNNALSNKYYFPPDIQKEIAKQLMKPILTFLIADHLKFSHIAHAKLFNRVHTHSFTCAQFHPEKNLFAAGSTDNKIYLATPNKGVCIGILNQHAESISALTFAQKNTALLASGDDSGTIYLWDLNTQKITSTLVGHDDIIQDICFSPDEKLLASSSEDQTIRIWDIKSGACKYILHGHENQLWKLRFKNNTTLYSSATDKIIRVWDLKKGTEIKQFGPTYGELAQHKNVIATDTRDYTIHLIDATTQIVTATLSGHTNYIFGLDFSPDGTLLVSASDDKTIKIWDIATKKCLRTLKHDKKINSVCFSPDGNKLLSTSADKTARVWNIFSKNTQKFLEFLQSKTTPQHVYIENRQQTLLQSKLTLNQALFLTLAYQINLANQLFYLDKQHLVDIYKTFPIYTQRFIRKHFAISIPKSTGQNKRKRYIYDYFEPPSAKRRKKS